MIRKISAILPVLFCLCLSMSFAGVQAQEVNKETWFSQHKYMPFYNLKKAGNTQLFQGNNKKAEYFEGWYFKMVSKDGSAILSVIPGISLSADGEEQHAFIQLINGVTAETSYHSFPIEEFSFSKKEFAIRIGENYFSKGKMILSIQDKGTSVSGEIKMLDPVNYKSGRLINPGIMGWYRFVPYMECYHGVVSLTHGLEGKLSINNEEVSFTRGRGYIEKDWGSSMPSAWIWMQSNHFSDTTSSFMLSIADIPWRGNSFTGFLGFFYHNNTQYTFATYRPSELELEITDDELIKIRIENKEKTFIIHARSNTTGMLKAPNEGLMNRRIPESIDAVVKITMLDNNGNILYKDSTSIAGLEMVGNYRNLEGSIK